MKKKIFILLIMALVFMAPACPPKPPTPKIWITICNDFPDMPPAEARIANEFCPATHPAQYIDKDGQRPTEICSVHKAPPIIPVVDIPYKDKHMALIWEGLLLGYLSSKEYGDFFKKEKLIAYADALATDGIPMIRSFSCFYDEANGWESWKPVDAEYRPIVQARLQIMADRHITTIVSLEPYGALAPDADIDWIIDTCLPFLDWIVFETANESGDMNLHRSLISKVKAKGVPNDRIQIYWVDSGDFADALVNTLEGKGLATLHGVGSMATVDKPGTGWSTSPGCMKLMTYGLYGSSDGEDNMKATHGYCWYWLEKCEAQRPTPEEAHDVTSWFCKNGRGWEFLSAAGFQDSKIPNIDKAIELGHPERLAMRRAYNEAMK
jgi:hypothetical protein